MTTGASAASAASAPTMAAEVFYEVVTHRLNEQLDRISALDSKAAHLFIFTSAALPIFGGLLTFSGNASVAIFCLVVAAGIVYLGLVALTFSAYRPRDFSLRPDLDEFARHCTTYDDATMRRWVAEECLRSIRQNELVLLLKSRDIQWSMACVALLSALLIVATILALLG